MQIRGLRDELSQGCPDHVRLSFRSFHTKTVTILDSIELFIQVKLFAKEKFFYDTMFPGVRKNLFAKIKKTLILVNRCGAIPLKERVPDETH